MKITRLLTLFFAFALLFNISCLSDNDNEMITPEISYGNGYFISNEGKFNDKNASVTFVTRNLAYKQENIYAANNNNAVLGDVLQMIAFSGNNAFLVMNNSNKIVVVNRNNFKKVGEITDQIFQPRSMTVANGNLYVTNYDFNTNKYVTVYKASDFSFVKKIEMNGPAEKIVEAGGNVFVQNASGGYGNKITYINTGTNTIQSEITMPGDINRMISYDTNVYTITGTATDSYIYKVSSTGVLIPADTKVLTGIPNATNLQIENGYFYFSSGNKVYSMKMNSPTAPTSPLLTAADGGPYLTLYGFSVIDGRIFASDIKGFTQDSEITVYSAMDGSKIISFPAGRGSNGTFLNQ
ncbi:YncE family protein [Chryseobacterium vrystaatense]|uniref:40-residue YVTN family beta-propeller repeat-containing protein n=1 Tax=Chryseobacterium vrystaatense TaxID=307480 RepID=A0A1M5JFK3_9FLAO|nr:DUF5074 domain-containing protein [Chryseobacterium vrystaatense]SHG39155.1 hypothetical protein SAMN02787073_4174 [Chryseobacterium vrystaatense]